MLFFSLWKAISRMLLIIEFDHFYREENKHSHNSVDYPYYILQAHEVLNQMFEFSIFINYI